MSAQHTKTPWSYNRKTGRIVSDNREDIACMMFSPCLETTEETDRRGAHIVKCVNAHDELVERLKEFKDFVRHASACTIGSCHDVADYDLSDELEQAIANAEGEGL